MGREIETLQPEKYGIAVKCLMPLAKAAYQEQVLLGGEYVEAAAWSAQAQSFAETGDIEFVSAVAAGAVIAVAQGVRRSRALQLEVERLKGQVAHLQAAAQ